MAIWFGVMGHEWAWRGRHFDSFEQYQTTMRAWNSTALWMTVVNLAVLALPFVLLFASAVWLPEHLNNVMSNQLK